MRKFVTLKQILYETNEYLTSLVYNWSTFAENQIQMSTNQFKHSTMEKLRKLILSFFALLASTVMYAHGSVVDASGESVIGATVMEKGTSNGTITDFDGNFTIKVNEGVILVISYIGYQTQEVPAQQGMKVTLKDDSELLKEVVVTGYTTQRKVDLTGAISTVSVNEIAKQNENNPMKALQGRVPGMNITADGNPSGAATVRIRGVWNPERQRSALHN